MVNKQKEKKNEKKISKEEYDLVVEVKRAERELFEARDKMGFVLDEELIDYYIYEVSALEKKYEYLLRKAKNIG